jgi:allantoin racemase
MSTVGATIGYCVATTGYTPEEQARRRAILDPLVPCGVSVELLVVPGGPRFLDRRSDFDLAIEAASAFLRSVDTDRFRVLISAGAIDPGLARFRDLSPIPVIGPGEAALYLGSLMRLPLSIVTVDEHAVAVSHELIKSVAVKPPIASIRSIAMPVRQVVDDLDGARAAVLREATAAVQEDGARAVYLGAITLATLGVDEILRRELGVAVLNPIEIALTAAIQCLRAEGSLPS